jgi:hypothetical protein
MAARHGRSRDHLLPVPEGAEAMNGKEWTLLEIDVRAFIERVLKERHDLYMEKFQSSKEAVTTALAAAKEQTASAFASSEKAVGKSEENQKELNQKNNEFRQQLKDQAEAASRDLMPRLEVQAIVKNQDEKIDAHGVAIGKLREELSMTAGRATLADPQLAQLLIEVKALNSGRSQATGASNIVGPLIIGLSVMAAGTIFAVAWAFVQSRGGQ